MAQRSCGDWTWANVSFRPRALRRRAASGWSSVIIIVIMVILRGILLLVLLALVVPGLKGSLHGTATMESSLNGTASPVCHDPPPSRAKTTSSSIPSGRPRRVRLRQLAHDCNCQCGSVPGASVADVVERASNICVAAEGQRQCRPRFPPTGSE
jgi:hypothetical protein